MTNLKMTIVFFVGAIFALFVVFITDALLSDPLANASNAYISPVCNDTTMTRSYENTDTNSTFISETSQPTMAYKHQNLSTNNETNSNSTPDTEVTESECNSDCLDTLNIALSQSGYINPEHLQLASDHAVEYAEYLQQNPSQLASLELAIAQITDRQQKDTLLFIFSKLPIDSLASTASNLSQSDNIDDRIAAISLFESSMTSSEQTSKQFNNLVQNEKNDKVLIRTLQAFDQLQPSNVDIATLEKVSDLMINGETEQVKKAALFAKINVITDDNLVRDGLFTMLSDSSTDLQLAGLQAADTILARQKYSPQQGDWQSDTTLRDSINRIANNPSASPQLRIEALNLINRHY